MESKRIFGTIIFPESGEKLENVWLNLTEGAIYLEIAYSFYGDTNWPILQGQFNGMDVITLVNCRTGGGGDGMGGSYRRVNVSYIIEDFAAKSMADLQFKEIVLRSPALRDWIVTPNSIQAIDKRTLRLPEEEIIISVKLPGYVVEILQEYPYTLGFSTLTAEKICSVIIRFDQAREMNEVYEMIRNVKKLILFLTYKNPEFSRYSLSPDSKDWHKLTKKIEPLNETQFTQQISIYYGDVKDKFSEIVSRWFTDINLHPVLDLVLQKCYNPQMSVQAYFLNVCVALETFHRRINQKQAKKATLKDRLNEFKPTMEVVFSNFKNYTNDDLINGIKDTRNDLAHEGEALKRFKNLIELFIITKGIEFTIRLELMKYLGIDIDHGHDPFLTKGKETLDLLIRWNKEHL